MLKCLPTDYPISFPSEVRSYGQAVFLRNENESVKIRKVNS